MIEQEVKTVKAPNGLDVNIDAMPEFYKDWSLEDMVEKEKILIEEIDAAEKEIKAHHYELKRSGEHPRQSIGQNIAEFLSRTECTWEYTKGMFDLIEFWKSSSLKIPYSYFDSTVRVLGQLKYKGDDYGKVVRINEYFQEVRDAYKLDVERMIELSMRHNALMQAMDNFKKINNIIDECTESSQPGESA